MNYAAYKARLRAVTDADDDITWITMNGNHIPIKEGQSKEEAVKEWLAKKGGGNESKKSQPENKKDKDPEFETVRKNALANPNTYGGKYTQKSKSAAYKEYKDDTSSPESLRKANEFVNSEVVSKSNPDTLPPTGRYKEYLNKITRLTGMTIESAREKYGTYTEGQWQELFAAKKEPAKPKNTYLSNPDTLKEFANHFGITESAAKKASEKFGDSFYHVMTKDPNAGVNFAVNADDYEQVDVENWLKNNKASKKPATKEQTIGELKSAGKDITKLQQAMQHIDYGFYEEKGKNMTPAQLVEHLEKEYANAAGKKDYYSTRVRTRYPEAIKLAKGYAESGTEKNDKQVFYKNVSGKQIYNKPGISTAKKGYTVVENELLTEAEMKKHGFDPNSSGFKKMELGKNEHRYQMGARFESGGAKESSKSTGGESSASKQPADIMEWKFDDVMKLKPSDSRVHKYIAKNNGLSTATVALLSEAFGSTEDLYNTIDQISDRKGYGWDKIKKDDD